MIGNTQILGHHLGFSLQGDIGPYTLYTSRKGRVVVFLKAPPKTVSSPSQRIQRCHFSLAALTWKRLAVARRAAWARAATKIAARATGYNLFTAFICTGRTDLIRTIEHQSHESLLE